jgi:formylglycine-generating enzyme required for sulfatase activity
MNWYAASQYCEWAGLGLPTEAQWEKAARGTDERIFPWGNAPVDSTRANYRNYVGEPTSVGAYPSGASPYGVLDMAGNVEEWVFDWFESGHYYSSDLVDPTGPSLVGDEKVTRGGSFRDGPAALPTFIRAHMMFRAASSNYIGFRCARN